MRYCVMKIFIIYKLCRILYGSRIKDNEYIFVRITLIGRTYNTFFRSFVWFCYEKQLIIKHIRDIFVRIICTNILQLCYICRLNLTDSGTLHGMELRNKIMTWSPKVYIYIYIYIYILRVCRLIVSAVISGFKPTDLGSHVHGNKLICTLTMFHPSLGKSYITSEAVWFSCTQRNYLLLRHVLINIDITMS
jgi:hypothetical protein